MPSSEVPTVFMDANVVIQAGRPPGGPILARVKDLVEAGYITVLTTDLTVQEVAKKHAKNDYDLIKGVGSPHFRRVVEQVLGVGLPDTTKAKLEAKLIDNYRQSTQNMFDGLAAKTLEIDGVKPSTVFDAYAAEEGFFGDKGKKNQFPDAFIFEALKMEAADAENVIIVSGDGDFEKPVSEQDNITLVKSLPELF